MAIPIVILQKFWEILQPLLTYAKLESSCLFLEGVT